MLATNLISHIWLIIWSISFIAHSDIMVPYPIGKYFVHAIHFLGTFLLIWLLLVTCDLWLWPCYLPPPVSLHVFHKLKDLTLFFTVQVANMIRFLVDSYNKPVPAILEIPSKDHPYDPAHDSVLSRVKYLFNTESVASGRRWIHLLQLQLFGGVCCFSLYNMDNNLFLKFRVLCSCSLNNLCCLGII